MDAYSFYINVVRLPSGVVYPVPSKHVDRRTADQRAMVLERSIPGLKRIYCLCVFPKRGRRPRNWPMRNRRLPHHITHKR